VTVNKGAVHRTDRPDNAISLRVDHPKKGSRIAFESDPGEATSHGRQQSGANDLASLEALTVDDIELGARIGEVCEPKGPIRVISHYQRIL
jgi:hypothetical protein